MKSNQILILICVFLLSACSTTPEARPEPTIAQVMEQPTATDEPESQTLSPTETKEILPSATTISTETEIPLLEGQISFSNDVFPIIDNRCINCHGEEKIEEGLNMTSYAGIMAGSVNGMVVIPGDPENSLFVEMVATQKMPKRGAKLTPAQVQIFSDWVAQGALDN